jgi:hypothetical protein
MLAQAVRVPSTNGSVWTLDATLQGAGSVEFGTCHFFNSFNDRYTVYRRLR